MVPVGVVPVGGSSPRARGTGRPQVNQRDHQRFIPARAGNGEAREGRHQGAPVHPRARGERRALCLDSRDPGGSSPRARGTVPGSAAWGAVLRFIPARAGNGEKQYDRECLLWVHPRARGERVHARDGGNSVDGSSPRARGTAGRWFGSTWLYRFIPARAGNGMIVPDCPSFHTVHPRARGERVDEALLGHSRIGSSPRARGTGRFTRLRLCLVRFIPARAGNGRAMQICSPVRPVHPRARGERRRSSHTLLSCGGSSPRARGTAVENLPLVHHQRFIPARAGNG